MTNKGHRAISSIHESAAIKICKKIAFSTFVVYQFSSVVPAFASPTGGTVIGGEGSINQQGASTTINQTSNRLAVDWQTFNVGENESVQFIQPGQDAIALNRILDQNPSQILGRIDANGNVMLMNERGIIFGRSASINVGGLVASSLDIDPDEFMNAQSFSFSAIEGTVGVVINQGLINAATGGSVSLIGKSVKNEGIIVANLGKVNVAAGSEAVLTFGSDGLMGVEVTREVLENDIGIDSAVVNSGTITGEGTQVALTATVSRDLFCIALTNTGTVQVCRLG
jgi:filamentous hemagglutinin family protein